MFWAQVKALFRPILLEKMFQVPRGKNATPLRDAVREALRKTPTTSIPKFIDHGLRFLEADAKEILEE